MELQISDLEKDIIKEILNIGLARAADSFASISKDRVLLKVPDMELINANEVLEILKKFERTHEIIQSDIKGDFNGTTLMVFSAKHIEKLSQVCLYMELPYENALNEMQESLLLEISNIITGAFVTQLANILKADIYGSPPSHPQKGALADSLKNVFSNSPIFQPIIFTVITHFTNFEEMVELPLFLFFDTQTFTKILDIIRSYNFYELN
ncbi:chemotaxis protein CheC [Adhaeribacter aquaticus]|uniref:chemotaxis protein CheC n=1 Tax=Adhaeribacter aquaticus TaxID=299567 RepID=UPI00040389EA|nr:chemotaxis protein CheC [Adhaeribacter aquaticus]